MTAGVDEQVATGIDPARMEIFLSVLAEVEALDVEHPDSEQVRRAVGKLFKTVKRLRRKDVRDAILANDAAVTNATATGAIGRIDDETQGNLLSSGVESGSAGTLIKARACYVCKVRYQQVDSFYHQLCPDCAVRNRGRRDARTDLSGRRALLTGGRAKIGMYIALRLLRDGAHTTITTRFPNDAVRRFTEMPDSADWIHRLKIVGIDLRDPAQVVALADSVSAEGPLDILINNAAQTVRRSAASYGKLIEAEAAPLPAGVLPDLVVLGKPTVHGRAELAAAAVPDEFALTPHELTAL
ncbi:MAG: SDR family NAD(P)-dependent oxidoreductase, partial [Streptosporangiaceae bacterium]